MIFQQVARWFVGRTNPHQPSREDIEVVKETKAFVLGIFFQMQAIDKGVWVQESADPRFSMIESWKYTSGAQQGILFPLLRKIYLDKLYEFEKRREWWYNTVFVDLRPLYEHSVILDKYKLLFNRLESKKWCSWSTKFKWSQLNCRFAFE